MSPRKRYSFWIDDRQADGLKAIKHRDGILESEQIRRAIDAWLDAKALPQGKQERKLTANRRKQ